MSRITAVTPLPFHRRDWAPAYLLARNTGNVDRYWPGAGDPQGMYPRPPGYHSGWDIFAPAGTPVVAPATGRIVHRSESRGTTGQVFGGVIGVESQDGPAFIFRHIVPLLPNGTHVRAGDVIARVSEWDGGAPHAHMEVYKFWPASYSHVNTIDPMTISWTATLPDEDPIDYYVEDVPHTAGGTGPAIVGQRRGYARLKYAQGVATIHRGRGRLVSVMQDRITERYIVLWWLPGTHKDGLPIFGPGNQQWAKRTAERREANREYPVRVFRGRPNATYPV